MQLWIYLHFPSLQLDSLFSHASPSPLVIVNGRKYLIQQANSKALEQGIHLGMGLGSAAALCSELQVHPYDEKVEERALLDIAQWLYVVTSDIVLLPPNGVLLKATNMLTLYGGLSPYWKRLSQHINALKLNYHFSTGFSPFSAILLAKSATNIISDDKEDLQKRLETHRLEATELDAKQVGQLQRVGIHTISDLLALPMREIARRFNIDLVNYVGRLLGQFKHPVTFYHPPEKFSSYLELLFDIENVQWLEKPLTILLNKLEAFLILRNQVGYELTLTLHQRDNEDSQVVFTSACGDYLAPKWLTLCRLSMEALTLDSAVHGLTLNLTRSGELESNSEDMFVGRKGQQSELELITLLQAKLGRKRVCMVKKIDDPRPEKALCLCAPSEKLSHKPKDAEPTLDNTQQIDGLEFKQQANQPLRPSVLFPKPQPLNEKVDIVLGPERIVSGWWDDDNVTRDYFIARSSSGQWLWVFRTLEQQWFIHGQFS